MASKVETSVLEVSEEIINNAINKIITGMDGAILKVKLPSKGVVAGCAIAAATGVAGYFATSKIEKIIHNRKLKKYSGRYPWRSGDSDGDVAPIIHTGYDMDENRDGDEEDSDISEDNSRIIVPSDLDNDPTLVNSDKWTLDKLVKEYVGEGKVWDPEPVNPSIQVSEDFDKLDGKVNGYRQKVVIYVAQDDIAICFDEMQDKFVEIRGEDIFQGSEYAADTGSEEVFVANHDKEIIYDIQVDKECSLEEILHDANQEDLGESDEE